MSLNHYSTSPGVACLRLGSEEARRWYRFDSLSEILTSSTLDEVVGVLAAVEERTAAGAHAVGFVSYEAAAAFDPALRSHEPLPGLPLVWFAIHADRREIPGPPVYGGDELPDWTFGLDGGDHRHRVESIRTSIERGTAYQVNLTFPLRADRINDAGVLFAALVERQDVPYAAFLDQGRWIVASGSPELFFRRDGRRITTRPMKGTASRLPEPGADRRQRQELLESVKDRAENLMIVDMLRNDLGKVADPGSVRVEELFRVERYSTVWQMTSTVSATTGASLPELFRALFPCASITGAPKPSAMQVIRQVENGPRGVYTGAIGWVGPRGRAEFSVAIRTALVDRASETATYGVGGGIVWDSQPDAEYAEALGKSRGLETPRPPFQLVESLLWRPGRAGFWLRPGHLRRLRASAEYFGWPYPNEEELRAALDDAVRGCPRVRHKVRLLLSADGRVEVEVERIPRRSRTRRVVLARSPVDRGSPFLYHKTTVRGLYDAERAALPDGVDDALLWNADHELTESTVANLVLEIDGRKWTPPVSAGLLAGVYRGHLLRRGEIEENPIRVDDLQRAERIWLVSSVRGWLPAHLEERPD